MKVHTRSAFLRAFDSRIGGAGGDEKYTYLVSGKNTIKRINLCQAAFSDLLSELWVAFGFRYESDAYASTTMQDPEKADAEVQKLESHEWIVGVLEDALKNEQWKNVTNDGAVKHSIIETENPQIGAYKRKSEMEEYCTKPKKTMY
ncbi:hypothetical protein MPER_08127 [Moniliophthora perniciosa FA553]|nr:hypothetical protein MPER_08127 [Moniliophthora perniciosa FA553]